MKGFKLIVVGVLCFSSVFSACKKTNNQLSDNEPTHFSFEYNGRIYQSTVTNGVSDWGLIFNNVHEAIGIVIDMPNIFGGRIIFKVPDCAYLIPFMNWDIREPGCSIYTDGQTIDSSTIYYYKSGSISSTKSNCRVKTGTDWITGLNYNYTLCDYAGTFLITVENKKGDIIGIKNGSFKITYQFE